MKNYLVLNTSSKKTNWFMANDRATMSAKCHLLNWKVDETVTCALIDGYYAPVLFCTGSRLNVLDASKQSKTYLSLYLKAVSDLPINFPSSIRFRKE